MRGFSIYFVFLADLPANLASLVRALFARPRFAIPNAEIPGALSPEEFEKQRDTMTRVIVIVRPTLPIVWLLGLAACFVWSWWLLAVPLYCTFCYLTFYFQNAQRLNVGAVAVVAKNYRGLWEALMKEAYDTVRGDERLNAKFDSMDGNNASTLEAVRDSVSICEWNQLRHAFLWKMGAKDAYS